MSRTFEEWWITLPSTLREKIHSSDCAKPLFNEVNYIWVTNLINNKSEKLNLTVSELLEWVVSGQVDARRK